VDYNVTGFDPTRHGKSWRTAWMTLAKKVGLVGIEPTWSASFVKSRKSWVDTCATCANPYMEKNPGPKPITAR
jgi:hypothetical protein